MADGTSVGVISLDLVIKNKIGEQLNSIAGNIQKSFSKPIEQAAQTAEKAVESCTKEIDEGFGTASKKAIESQQKAIQACMAEYDKFQSQINQAAEIGKAAEAVKIKYNPEYDSSKVEAEVDELAEKIAQKIQNKAKSSSEKIKQTAENSCDTVNQSVNTIDEKIGSFTINAVKKLSSVARGIRGGFSSAASYAAKGIRKTLGGSFNFIRKTGSNAVDSVRSKFSRLRNTVDSTSKPLNKFAKSLKSAAKRVFVMAGVLVLLKGIRSAVTDAVSGNEEFAKSLNEIKANLSVAFMPIMQTVMPYLNALMSGIAAVTKTVAAFISELFGSTYQKSLEAVKKAKSAQKEAEKAQKSYLASFDEMNVAGDNDSESSDSGSDVDYSAIDSNVQLPDWAEKLKDSIKSGDWAGVGSLIAEKVNGTFANINWDGIRQKLNGFVDNLTSGLNSFINGIDWTGLGDSFGGGINTIFDAGYRFMKKFDWAGFGKGTANFMNGAIKKTDWTLIGKTFASRWSAVIDYLYAFVTTFDWSGFGSSIGNSVNGWFDEIDWAKLGVTVSESIKGLFDTLMGFLETVDWQGIGEKLWTFIASIDWSGIASKLFQLIGSAIGGAVSLLWGFIKDAVFSIRDYFTEKIQECGGNIVEGLFTGIIDGIKNIGIWLYDHVLKPFIEGFKNCFGIHSPSTVMAEMGDFIIQGLYNAVSDGIAKVKEIFGKVLSAIKGVFKDIGAWFKKTFSCVFSGIKSVLNGIITFVTGIFTGNWKKAWQGVKNILKGIWDSFVSIVKIPINLIIGLINGLTGAVESAINWIIDGINSISIDVPDWLSDITGIETLGFNLDTIDIPEIPNLAKGAVIPPNSEFLAVLGDQKRGTNIEAPLDTIKQAVAEVLAANGSGGMSGSLTIPIYLNTRRGLRLLSTEIIDDINDIISSTGNVPIDL